MADEAQMPTPPPGYEELEPRGRGTQGCIVNECSPRVEATACLHCAHLTTRTGCDGWDYFGLCGLQGHVGFKVKLNRGSCDEFRKQKGPTRYLS